MLHSCHLRIQRAWYAVGFQLYFWNEWRKEAIKQLIEPEVLNEHLICLENYPLPAIVFSYFQQFHKNHLCLSKILAQYREFLLKSFQGFWINKPYGHHCGLQPTTLFASLTLKLRWLVREASEQRASLYPNVNTTQGA